MKKIHALFAAAAALPAVAAPLALDMDLNGAVLAGSDGARVQMTIYHEGWDGSSTGVRSDFRFPDAATGSTEFDFIRNNGKVAVGRATLVQTNDGRALYAASVTSQADMNPEGVCLTVSMSCDKYCGGSWAVDGKAKRELPKKYDGNQSVFRGNVSSLTLSSAGGEAFTLTFPMPMHVYIQDDRRWTASFTVRISTDGGRAFRKGDQRAFTCIFSSPDGVEASVAQPVLITRGRDWVPLDYRKDIEAGSALDFSGMGLQDAPAGKYGWLKNEGGHFAFERKPGERQRFYGVNLCFSACFPDKETADRLVTRLVRLGYNALRFHHYERGLVMDSPDRLALNAEQADRLDYLLARAYEKGIYATTDLFTSRPVMWRDIGIDQDGECPMQIYKNLIGVHGPAFENWKAFAKNLMTHVNPYTGRAYKDEPALPLISLVNEGHLSWCWDKIKHLAPMKEAWRKWLAAKRAADPSFAKGVSDDSSAVPGFSWDNTAPMVFMADVEADVAKRQRAFLRSLGAKALLTSQNCGEHYSPMMVMREACYDYVDDHFYVDHPHFIVRPWSLPSRCGNANPVFSSWLPPVMAAYTRMSSKPFCITEWNFSGPGMFRGVGGIMTGAMGALQEWDGLWRFAYSHDIRNFADGEGLPGYFDMASDPLSQASDRASICLFLRRDMPPLTDRLAISAASQPGGVIPEWNSAAWQTKVATAVAPAPAGVRTFPFEENRKGASPPFPLAPNPSLAFDRSLGSFRIDTPRTAGGFTPKGALEAGPVAFDVGDVPATVWASSLDGKPIAKSSRILVSHLTDVQAEGNMYADKEKKTLLKWGRKAIVVRNGTAAVTLSLDNPEAFEVWGLETTGRRLEKIPSAVRGGRLSFTAAVKGAHGARMLYEVARKER